MPIDGQNLIVHQVARDPLVVCMRTDDALARAAEVSVSELSARLRIFRDPEIHPTAHDKLVEMLVEVGIEPEASCLAATPADIQWMVRAGYGVALVDQKSHSRCGADDETNCRHPLDRRHRFRPPQKGQSPGSAISDSVPSAGYYDHACDEIDAAEARDGISIEPSRLIRSLRCSDKDPS